jgi:hypothetical protein
MRQATLDPNIPQIVQQIAHAIGRERYNHYRPANALATVGVSPDFFQKATLDIREAVFKKINRRLA